MEALPELAGALGEVVEVDDEVTLPKDHPVLFAEEEGPSIVVLVFGVYLAGEPKWLREPEQIRILALPVPAYGFP